MSHLHTHTSPQWDGYHSEALVSASASIGDLSWLSHELRTPMTSLKGAVDLLAAGTLGAVPASLVPLVTIAQRNSTRLANLLEDLLWVEKLNADANPLRLQVTDLRILLREVIAMQPRPICNPALNIALTDHVTDADILADPPWLKRALARMLDNISRAAPPPTPVAIAIHRSGSDLCVSFRHRGQPRATGIENADGANPGFLIASGIIGRHGGTITHIAHPETGTEWKIRLPAAPAPTLAQAQAQAHHPRRELATPP